MKKPLIVLAISLMLAAFAAVSFASPIVTPDGGSGDIIHKDSLLPSQDGDGDSDEDGEGSTDDETGTDTDQDGDSDEEEPDTAEGDEDSSEDAAQDDGDEAENPNPYPELILNGEEGGLVSINGLVTYTNPFFGEGTVQPLVILEDQTGFVDRNTVYIFPLESQVLGQITSDFKQSPFSYSMVLPIEPRGGQRDVDNDGIEEAGVQIYAPAYWDNTYGGPFLEERDMSGGGWSTAYASTVTSSELETQREIVGGKLVVYSPDDTQEFPINFGEDGLLFTADEQEMVVLPQGWTVVNLDDEPFTFDRSRTQDIPLLEPEGAALIDYSELSYTEAFDALVEELRENYAFTDVKGVDWDELKEEYMPRFEEAEENESNIDYRRALRDFLWEIPDGHVSGGFVREDFLEAISGGIGMGIRDVDDGRIIVNYLLDAGPAADADILLGAEIISINGVTATNWIDDSIAWSAPFSTDHNRRLQKLRYATRFEADSEVSIEFINPEETEPISITVSTVAEFDSFSQSSFFTGRTGLELPVEFELLDEGIGYVEITGFLDNQLLTVQLWERMIKNLNDNEIDTLVIDMRQNGGGFGFLADMMASYFFDEAFITGNAEEFDDEAGLFVTKPENARKFILPPDRSMYYDGQIAVLVGPACASACEFFSYDMTINNRATIVGQYPSAGLGGSVSDLRMPDGESVRYTVGRAVDGEGNIHIEGIGVQPDLIVPVTEETLFTDEDVVLQTAIDLLEGNIEVPGSEDASEESEGASDEGDFELAASLVAGDLVSGTLEAGESIFYEVSLVSGDVVDILAVAEDMLALDLIMNVYDETGEQVDTNDDIGSKNFNPGFLGIAFDQDFTFVIEITAFDEEASGDFTFGVLLSEETDGEGSDG